jgi:DNA-binding NarL/FixJ family response regulator
MNKTRANSPGSKCRVFLIDDHPIVRQGLALFIDREPDLMVCGEADGAASAPQAIRDSNPDFIVLDISLDGPDGLELLKTLRTTYPNLPVLVLSMHDESTYAERALRAGANGYIMKQEATEKVLVAIRHILQGEVYLSDRLTKRMLQQFVHGSISPRDPLAKLSDRELEVYRLIGAGHATRQIEGECTMAEVPYGHKTQKPSPVSDIHIVWMTSGLGCDGDSVSITRLPSPASRT